MKEVPRPKPDAYKSMDEGIPPREKEHEPSSGDDPKPPGGFAQEGNNGSEQSAPWPEPQPLEDYLSPVLPMCREMMPDPLAEWAIDVSDQVRCPLDFVFSTALVIDQFSYRYTRPNSTGTLHHLGDYSQPLGGSRRPPRLKENPRNLRSPQDAR
jgi:hypothetical protein